MASDRTFVLEGSSVGHEDSHFKSSTPGGAAKKATRILFKKLEDSKTKSHRDAKVVQFIIRETTRGSKQKTFAYSGHKIELKEPKVLDKLPPLANGEFRKVFFEFKARALRENDVYTPLRNKMNANNAKIAQ